MKIEDEFLTIKQARELKKLGVSFIGANFGIYNFYESLAEDEINEIRKLDKVLRSKLVVETLSVYEMIEMLPDIIQRVDIIASIIIHLFMKVVH